MTEIHFTTVYDQKIVINDDSNNPNGVKITVYELGEIEPTKHGFYLDPEDLSKFIKAVKSIFKLQSIKGRL